MREVSEYFPLTLSFGFRFVSLFSLSLIHTEVDRVAEVWSGDRFEREKVKFPICDTSIHI